MVYHVLTDEEMSEANLNRDQREAMTVERFTTCTIEEHVKVTREDLVRFDEYAKRWRLLGSYSSSSSTLR